MSDKKPLSIIIPAYNEAQSLPHVLQGIREALHKIPHEVIVVDDGSEDETAQEARKAGGRVIQRWITRGYGASLKAGIRAANYEWIVTLDADGQHDPGDIVRLYEQMQQGCDAVIGVRQKGSYQYASRIPGKRFLQWFSGFLVGVKPLDVNSGLRLFRKDDALGYAHLLPNGFSFSTTLTLAMLKDGMNLAYIPIQTRPRVGRRSTVSIMDGFRTILLIIRIAALFNPIKVFVPASGFLFLMGGGYALFNIFVLKEFNIPSGAEFLMISGVLVFFFGILADQVASIRRGGSA